MSLSFPSSQILDSSPPSVDRAMDALTQAALISEGASFQISPFRVRSCDLQAATKLDPKAVREHLDRVMMGSEPEAGLDNLQDCGAMGILFPEVSAMVGFGDGEWRHKDVWKHTKQVVRQASLKLEIRWAALFHDIGKVRTRTFSEDGKVQFLGHAEVGARMFNKLDRRIPLFSQDESLKRTIHFLVLHHLRANQYDSNWSDSAVRRFARELGCHLDSLLCLARADITTKRPEKKKRGLDQIDELARRISALAELDAVEPLLPSGVGDEIMRAFSLKPSRLIGEIKKELEEAIENKELLAKQPSSYYVDYVARKKKRFKL